MNEDKSEFRDVFIKKISVEKQVELLDEEEVTLKEDGSISFFDGIQKLLFDNLELFADHYFLDKHVSYKVCQYVGNTDSEGNIVWHSIPAQDEDGKWYQKPISFEESAIDKPGPNEKVYTKPVPFL